MDRCETCGGPRHPNAIFQASHPEPESVGPLRVALMALAVVMIAVTLWIGVVLLLVSGVAR